MKNFDFVKNRKIFYAISLGIFALFLVFYLINGIVLDVNFKGGTRMSIETTQEIDANKAGQLVEGVLNGKKVSASTTKTFAGDTNTNVIMIRLDVAGNDPLTGDEEQKVKDVLKANFPVNLESKLNEVSSINPSIGKEMLQRGIFAVVISSVLILLYVAWRFSVMSMSAAVCAIIALLHDCIMMFGTFVIFQIPFNDIFIAALLTIIGYSINDTIIIYDRIRENSGLMKKSDHKDIVNTSIWQSLSRSVNTGVSVLISVLVLYIFSVSNNLSSLRDFSLSLMVGTITGCYSTIFIAAPLWWSWKNKRLQAKLAANGKA